MASQRSTAGNRRSICYLIKCTSYLAILTSHCKVYSSDPIVISEGRHFLLAFPENLPSECEFFMSLTAFPPLDNIEASIAVNISVPDLSNFTVRNLSGTTATSISLRESGLSPYPPINASHNNIIFVDASGGNLSIVGSIVCENAIITQRKYGEFLALPVEFWGTMHVIAAPELSCGYTVTVISSGYQTKVVLTVRSTPQSGTIMVNGTKFSRNVNTWTMPPYSRMEIVAVSTDITGTVIESQYPVGVIVGSKNEKVLVDAICSSNQTLFAEQLLPLYAWAKVYYIGDTNGVLSSAYTLHVVVVASLPDTTLYLDYMHSESDNKITFARTMRMKGTGSSHRFKADLAFDMVGADNPILVAIYATSVTGYDGAMMQAVQSKYWSQKAILRLDSSLAQTVHLFTNIDCNSSFTLKNPQTGMMFTADYCKLDYSKMGIHFDILSDVVGQKTLSQMPMYMNVSVPGCKGISAYVMNDISGGYGVFGASLNSWSVGCADEQHFDFEQKICVNQSATTAPSVSETTTISEDLLKPLPSAPVVGIEATGHRHTPPTLRRTEVNSESGLGDQTSIAASPAYRSEWTNWQTRNDLSDDLNQSSLFSLTTQTATSVDVHTSAAPSNATREDEEEEKDDDDDDDDDDDEEDSVTIIGASTADDDSRLTSDTEYEPAAKMSENPQIEITWATTLKSETVPFLQSLTPIIDSIEGRIVSTSETTTVITYSDQESKRQCPCFCMSGNKTLTKGMLDLQYLKVSVENLTRIKRLATCAEDWRPLAVGIGVGGIAVVVSTVLLLLLLDVDNWYRQLWGKTSNIKYK